MIDGLQFSIVVMEKIEFVGIRCKSQELEVESTCHSICLGRSIESCPFINVYSTKSKVRLRHKGNYLNVAGYPVPVPYVIVS